MIMILKYCFGILILFITLASCKKESSLEVNRPKGSATYTFLDTLGNCTASSVHGLYKVDSVFTDSNYVYINVNFNSTGKYLISTDTVNGTWFMDSGYALLTGPTTIKLKGSGTPVLPNASTYLLNQNSHGCGFTINTKQEDDYLPSSIGSSFRYQYLPPVLGNGNVNIDSFIITVSPYYTVFNNKNYLEYSDSTLNSTNPTYTYYFAKEGGNNYWEFGTPEFDYTSIFDNSIPFIEYIYLKTNQPVGTTWESAEIPNVNYGAAVGLTSKTGSVKDVFTITGVNQTLTVNGHIFQKVITVSRDVLFKETGGTTYTKVMYGQAMYSKGIGLINQEISIPNSTGIATEKTPILSWIIK